MSIVKTYAVVLALADILGVPLFIGWYIWWGQSSAPWTWTILALWLIATFLLHGDTPESLGIRSGNLWRATKNAIPVFVTFFVCLVAIGMFLGRPIHLPPNFSSLLGFWIYAGFCFLQQIGLNSLLANRLLSLIRKRWVAGVGAGILFSALHWPNPVLVPLTLVGGSAMSWLFARERNIIVLALGQAVIGSLAWWAFPLAWQHMLRVGPGYYSYH